MFPMKQKFNITAALFDSPLCYFFAHQACCTLVKNPKLDQIEKFGLSKKAAIIPHFCIIGNIHHNFLVPRMIELAPKIFMPIQTPDLHRVCILTFIHIYSLTYFLTHIYLCMYVSHYLDCQK